MYILKHVHVHVLVHGTYPGYMYTTTQQATGPCTHTKPKFRPPQQALWLGQGAQDSTGEQCCSNPGKKIDFPSSQGAQSRGGERNAGPVCSVQWMRSPLAASRIPFDRRWPRPPAAGIRILLYVEVLYLVPR